MMYIYIYILIKFLIVYYLFLIIYYYVIRYIIWEGGWNGLSSTGLQTDKELHWLFNVDRYTAWWKWHPPSTPTGWVRRIFRPKNNDQIIVSAQRWFQIFSTLKRSRRRRTAPSDPSLNQPSPQSPAACPERPYSSKTFINLNSSLNHKSKKLQYRWIDIPSSIEIFNRNFAENNELTCGVSRQTWIFKTRDEK